MDELIHLVGISAMTACGQDSHDYPDERLVYFIDYEDVVDCPDCKEKM